MNAKMDRDSRWHKTRPAERVGCTNSVRLRDLADLQRDRICAPHRLEQRREIDALEFTRSGDQVVLGARGPSISMVEDEPLEGQIFNVFTLRDRRIVRIDDYRDRREALTAAGVAEDADWR
jgi:hypothetical protein